MIVHDVEQGTPEWKALRLGRPTASQFHRICTPKTLKASGSAGKYRMELLAEWVSGIPSDDASSAFMERGTAMEQEAREYVELVTEADVQEVGFVTTDDGLVGASPDGLIRDDVCVEIKVPSLKVHLAYLLHGLDSDYALQMAGQLWVCERDLTIFCSYNPVVAPRLLEFARNDKVVDALANHVGEFCEVLEQDKAKLRDMGVVPASERAPVTSLAAADGVSAEEAAAIFDEL